jgi:flagellum-specific peptidoglycan hydrolase FlgJ
MTGFSFTHGTVADVTSPTSMPAHLVALSTPAQPAAEEEPSDDASLRSAIVTVANYYLRMAQSKTPAEMEALIWQKVSSDGVDHGESCAAFASLTLELGAQAAGQQSWVSGGSSYPWPLHQWADVRVDPNSASPNVVSVLQDAENDHRWHPLGDGYEPQPGDWVLFNGHVEVVTKDSNGVLDTIGGDSLPNFSVNAHQYTGSLSADGVVGFVNNGELLAVQTSDHQAAAGSQAATSTATSTATSSAAGSVTGTANSHASQGQAAVPGTLAAALSPGSQAPAELTAVRQAPQGTASVPGLLAIQDGVSGAQASSAAPAPAYHRSSQAPSTGQVTGTAQQAAFISQVAPGAMAAQRTYGIPAAVTIAQAIEESGWGQSALAANDHNLFGIKGTGPAGADIQPTQEYENGRWVTQSAAFKVYNNVAESITDHSQLLATGESYQHAMADRHSPDAFANDLTGIYATNPDYGSNLITIMRLYNLYRYDTAASAASAAASPTVTSQQGGTAAHSGTGTGTGSSSGASGQSGKTGQGGASIPGILDAYFSGTAKAGPVKAGPARTASAKAAPTANTSARREAPAVRRPAPRITSRASRVSTNRYVPQIPRVVTTDFITTAKAPLARSEPLYRDVANHSGIRWELLAACDWMQCKAEPRFSPVRGEKLGTVNPDGTVYRTKSQALSQCAEDLVELAMAVYWIDITARRPLSVRKLASIFAAFRWGGLLKLHDISAMEFPYSVEGLTAQQMKMRWPDIREPYAPDKPGSRFRRSFGAVPVVLSLDYPATDE